MRLNCLVITSLPEVVFRRGKKTMLSNVKWQSWFSFLKPQKCVLQRDLTATKMQVFVKLLNYCKKSKKDAQIYLILQRAVLNWVTESVRVHEWGCRYSKFQSEVNCLLTMNGTALKCELWRKHLLLQINIHLHLHII